MSDNQITIWISENEAAGLIEFHPGFLRKAVVKGSLKEVINYEKISANTYSYNKIDIDNYMYETKYAGA